MTMQFKKKTAKAIIPFLIVALILANGAIVLALQEFTVEPIHLTLSGNVPKDVYFQKLFKIGDTYLAGSAQYANTAYPGLYSSTDLETWHAVYDSGAGTSRSYQQNGSYLLTYIYDNGRTVPHYSSDAVDWYEVKFPDAYSCYNVTEVYDEWFLFRAQRNADGKNGDGILATADFASWKFIEDFPALEENHVFNEYDLRYNDDAWYIYSSFHNRSAGAGEDAYLTNVYKAAALPNGASSWTKLGSINQSDGPIASDWLEWTAAGDPVINAGYQLYTSTNWTDWKEYTRPEASDPTTALLFAMMFKLDKQMLDQDLYYMSFIVDDDGRQIGLYSGTGGEIDGAGQSVLQISTDGGETFTPTVAQVYYGDTLVSPSADAPPDGGDEETPDGGDTWQNPFGDVKPADWFYGDVEFAVKNGLMTGVSDTAFSPNTRMTRAALVTVLYRLEGSPAASEGDVPAFSDVDYESWYADAVSWAAGAGIITGVGDSRFAPNVNVTRDQMATILLNYAIYAGDGPEGAWTIHLDFEDTTDIRDWAIEGAMWCYMKGIITGKPGNLFDPLGSATRAEAATMLHRFMLL
ncbi:MAG: S-layer homology domain-containing protein [Oscillospiraceae bacterium]|jgi:hypothetical protein|nr:S-layer homology domain-containing protein [Oscillospiraceae bacterium]